MRIEAWHTNLPLTPAGVWQFLRRARAAEMEPRIRGACVEDLCVAEDSELVLFAANALYLGSSFGWPYNLITAFFNGHVSARKWQSMTLSKLRHRPLVAAGANLLALKIDLLSSASDIALHPKSGG